MHTVSIWNLTHITFIQTNQIGYKLARINFKLGINERRMITGAALSLPDSFRNR